MKMYHICIESNQLNIQKYGLQARKLKYPKQLNRCFPYWDENGILLFQTVTENLFRLLSLYIWKKELVDTCYLLECDVNPANLLGCPDVEIVLNDIIDFPKCTEQLDHHYLKNVDFNVCLVDIPISNIRAIKSIQIKAIKHKDILNKKYYHFITEEWWQHVKNIGVLKPYPMITDLIKEGLDLINNPYLGIWMWPGHVVTMEGVKDFYLWKKMTNNIKNNKGHLLELNNLDTSNTLTTRLKTKGVFWEFLHSLTFGSTLIHDDREFDIYLGEVSIKDITYVGTIEEVIYNINNKQLAVA